VRGAWHSVCVKPIFEGLMYSKRVKGFVQAQSWFQDYTKVWMDN
jgi:hypothetical protein